MLRGFTQHGIKKNARKITLMKKCHTAIRYLSLSALAIKPNAKPGNQIQGDIKFVLTGTHPASTPPQPPD